VGRLPWRRLTAWLIDWLVILVWVAVTAAIGIPLYAAGITRPTDPLALNVVSALVAVVPVVIGLAWTEASRRQASPGKRLRHLRVVDAETGRRVTFGRTLIRNVLKVGLPWTIGHAAVVAIVEGAHGSMAGSVWVLTALAYVLPLAYVASLFTRDGRTPYDRAARARVITAD
jgi:uncharacterized RDD family membrane protein YckC